MITAPAGAQSGYDMRHRFAACAAMQRRAVLGRHVGGVDDVLDADGNPAERPGRFARAAQVVRGPRLRERKVFVEERPRLYFGLDGANALEARLDQFLACESSLPDL
jgi:hypothetical protein